MSRLLILVLAVCLVACQTASFSERIRPVFESLSTQKVNLMNSGDQNEAVTPQTIDWLREKAIPFRTTQPETDFADLMPLKALIGEARIVALGEGTHGAHEFFQMKHRLIRFLVTEMDFTIVAFEANWPEANLINDYIQTGRGDAASLLAGLGYWTWNTQEVLDLIEWLQYYNQQSGSAPKVSFYGFDMQNAKLAMDNVLAYLATVDQAAMTAAQEKFACFQPYRDYTWQQPLYAQQRLKTRLNCRQDLQAVYDNLVDQQPVYEANSSPAAFAQALQIARLILQTEWLAARTKANNFMTAPRFNARDQAMAENVTWLLAQAGSEAKIILWAHNAHIQTTPWDFQGLRYKPMGIHLRQIYGHELVVLGFTFHTGAFNAYEYDVATDTYTGLKAHQANLPLKNSYEHVLHQAGWPHFFLDLRQLRPGAAGSDWLLEPHWLRFVGPIYDPKGKPEDFAYPVRLPDAFDGLVFIDKTSPSILLP